MRKRLVKYGIPQPVLSVWGKRFGGHLLPLQCRAIEEYGLLDGQSLLISAPTSSGKTFCGEMAIIRSVQERKKGIFIAPLKAVVEEKYRQFRENYSELGLHLAISTSDHTEDDADIESGRFDIAVMVYEKFNTLLLTNFDLLGQVGTLVIDELQMLGDKERGPKLELSLTKLLYSDYRPQIIALSAVLGEPSGLAKWLKCKLLLEKNRPVELRRGVAVNGKFHFHCHNSGETGEEEFEEGENKIQSLFRNIQEVLTRKHQALVFLKSRQETVTAAKQFAEYVGLEEIPENREFFGAALADEEESSLLNNLKSLISCGVAFHNADLTATQRLTVEKGYRKNLIKVIFATTTLSTGVNLPAATVFIDAQKYRPCTHTGRPGLEPLSWPEYESMSGRAGQMGLFSDKNSIARAVLFASSELEKTILWDYYVEKRPAPLKSELLSYSQPDMLIDLFGSELVKSPDDVSLLLNCSYHASERKTFPAIEENQYQLLFNNELLVRQDGTILTTPLGKAVAVTGLSVAGTDYFCRSLSLFQSGSDRQIIHRALCSPDGRKIYLPFENWRRARRFPFSNVPDDEPLVQELAILRRELTPDEANRIRLTFLLSDWMKGMSALDIESNYRLHLGMVGNLAGQAGWLLSSMVAIVRAYDRFSSLPERLEQLAFSATVGMPYQLKDIYNDLGHELFRSELIKLYHEGITTTDGVIESGQALLRKVVSSEGRLDRIEQKLQRIKERKMQMREGLFSGEAILPQSIEIVGTPIRERYAVRINDRPFNLTGKSFKYLVGLVWSRLTKDDGWLYKEDLERGFNQARYLYRLRQEIGRDFLPDWPLYESNRAGYYRLVANRDKIKVNLNALKENPDYEIQRMATDLTPLLAS